MISTSALDSRSVASLLALVFARITTRAVRECGSGFGIAVQGSGCQVQGSTFDDIRYQPSETVLVPEVDHLS